MDKNKSHYIQIALGSARYEQSSSGDFHGEIPGFYGLRAQAKSQADCENQLRRSLEEWLEHRLENGLSIPTVNGFSFATLDLRIEEPKVDKLIRLAGEIESLKIDLHQEPDRRRLISGKIRALNAWYKSYWQLLVSLASLSIILLAYGAYNVDPIESYRETGEKKRMAENYAQIGDELLLHSGFESAEELYRAALDLYPSNINARNGLLKAQILKPEKGRNDYDIQIAKTKLSLARGSIAEDYYLSYVEGVIALDQAALAHGDDQVRFGVLAKQSFEKSKRLNPEFSGSYLGLARHELYFQRPKAALKILEDAYANGRRSPSILIYLGSLNASYRRFDEALRYLTEANSLSTRLETLIIQGDVYRHKSSADPSFLGAAIVHHLDALKMASRSGLVRRADYDELLYTYMPRSVGDPPDGDLTPLPFIDPDHFKVLANYSLSLDYILKGEKDNADMAFEDGFRLDACYDQVKEFGGWYKNQIRYVNNERQGLPGLVQQWLKDAERRFDSCE